MKKEQALRFTAFFAVLWTILFFLIQEVIPAGVWGFITGILIYSVPKWLAKKIYD